jgi:hypothetical protein
MPRGTLEAPYELIGELVNRLISDLSAGLVDVVKEDRPRIIKFKSEPLQVKNIYKTRLNSLLRSFGHRYISTIVSHELYEDVESAILAVVQGYISSTEFGAVLAQLPISVSDFDWDVILDAMVKGGQADIETAVKSAVTQFFNKYAERRKDVVSKIAGIEGGKTIAWSGAWAIHFYNVDRGEFHIAYLLTEESLATAYHEATHGVLIDPHSLSFTRQLKAKYINTQTAIREKIKKNIINTSIEKLVAKARDIGITISPSQQKNMVDNAMAEPTGYGTGAFANAMDIVYDETFTSALAYQSYTQTNERLTEVQKQAHLDLFTNYLASYVWLESMEFLSGYVKRMLSIQRYEESKIIETLDKLTQAWHYQLSEPDFEGVAAATLKAAIGVLQGE